MNVARILILGVALAAGGAAAYLVAGGDEEKRPEPAPVVQFATVDVLIAKNDIGMGTAVSEFLGLGFEFGPGLSPATGQHPGGHHEDEDVGSGPVVDAAAVPVGGSPTAPSNSTPSPAPVAPASAREG